MRSVSQRQREEQRMAQWEQKLVYVLSRSNDNENEKNIINNTKSPL